MEISGPAQKDVRNIANHQRNGRLDQKLNAFELEEDGIDNIISSFNLFVNRNLQNGKIKYQKAIEFLCEFIIIKIFKPFLISLFRIFDYI